MGLLDYMRAARGIGNGKYIQYLPIYERHFKKWLDMHPVVLEIGVDEGSSLAMWSLYFGVHARIYGIDITPVRSPPPLGSTVFTGRQEDTEFLERVLKTTGPIDIIIDDGSHMSQDIKTTFEFLYPRMSKHGVYLIEDLHVTEARAFFDHAKGLIDQLTISWAPTDIEFHMNTMSMHFYESIVVFERGQPNPVGVPTVGSFIKLANDSGIKEP